MNLHDVVFNDKESAAINYVRARYAIEENFKKRAEQRAAKIEVVKFLSGTATNGRVSFPDNTTANF